MSSDNSDKTVFRQSPGGRSDSTIVRPTPGGRVGAGQAATQASRSSMAPPTHSAQRQETAHYAPADHPGSQFNTADGMNPLVNAAAMLIAVFSKVQQSMSHPNVGGFHQQLVNEIRNFDSRAKDIGVKPEIGLAARYVLCVALDEAVLNTPWGAESPWTQRTLLSVFHNETHGGEKFFQILDRMRERPAENLEILELMYVLLNLGYEGKYRVVQRGREKIEQLRDELFRVIRSHRGGYERTLSPSGAGLGKVRNSLAYYVPMWVIVSVFCGLLALGYSGFRYWLHQSSVAEVENLNALSRTGGDTNTKQ